MLDEFFAVVGYHRKYTTRILKHGRPRRSGKKHGFPSVSQGEMVVAVAQIWEICGRICSKRLHPILLRAYIPWDEGQSGFLEIDLVVHCDQTTEGQ
jgi:hypothetical protein